jgi:hypothetical protein
MRKLLHIARGACKPSSLPAISVYSPINLMNALSGHCQRAAEA